MAMRRILGSAGMAATRAVVAVTGGYALTAVGVVALAAVLARCGMVASDAVVTAGMLGFVAYLGVLLWALACPNLLRLAGLLSVWTGLFALLAWLADLGPPA